MITKFKKPVAASGTTIENEPIIKSDGASSNVMQWLSNNEASNITISEDGSNNLDLVVSSGNVGIGETVPANLLHVKASDTGIAPHVSSQIVLEREGTNYLQFLTAETGTSGILFGDGSDIDVGKVAYDHNIPSMQFHVEARTALTINSAGTVSTSSTAREALSINSSDGAGSYQTWENSDLAVFHIGNRNAISGGQGTYGIGTDLWATTGRGISFHTNATGAPRLDISSAGLVTVSNGIVETNGVLKENLLTNSGFDVWSNSTLEDVGSNLITGWTNTDYDTPFTTSGADITDAITDGSAAAQCYTNNFTTVTGKLYKIVVTLTLDSGTLPRLYVTEGDGSGYISGFGSKALVAGANTFVYEESSGGSSAKFTMYNDASSSDWNCTFTITEVTPGIVTGTAGPDGWKKTSTLDVYREHWNGAGGDSDTTKVGSFYALKSEPGAQYDLVSWPTATLMDSREFTRKFAGRNVTFGAWVKTSTASDVCLLTYDDAGNPTTGNSTFATADGNWHWMETTATISSAGGMGRVYFAFQHRAASPGTAYISQPMLVFGSAIGEGNYSRPSGEIVNCEKAIGVQANVSPEPADDKILNLEALSSGKIPKGAMSVNFRATVRNTSVTADQGVFYGWGSASTAHDWIRVIPVVSGAPEYETGWLPCDSNGDIYQTISEADSTLAGLYNSVASVQLR